MLNFKRIILTVLVGIFILSSCSIEKRIHRPGYHVEFNKKVKNTSENEALAVEKNTTNDDQVINQHNIKLDAKEEKNIKLASTSSKENSTVKEKENSTNKKVEKHKMKTTELKSSNKSEIVIENNLTTDNFNNSQVEQVKNEKSSSNLFSDAMFILILLLCFILPPLAVYLITEDIKLTIISILLSLLFWIPGVIFALYLFIKRY